MPAGEPLLLAIDTSTEHAGVALYDGERVREVTWDAGRNQSASLLVEVDRFLTLNRCTIRDVRAIAVAVGPGTFNGLRVGMAAAKGLGYAVGVPLIGVVTLDVVAYPHAGARHPIRAFVVAGRSRAVFADYRYRNSRWVRLSDLRNEPLERLADGLAEKTVLAGELPADVAAGLGANPLAVVPPPALRARRPSYLAEIAFGRWQSGDVDRLEALEPIYVHGSMSLEAPAMRATGSTNR